LDDLQNNGTLHPPVTFIYDACESGSFISNLRPPQGMERVVVTSSSFESAYFLENGKNSFSYQFWDNTIVNQGNLGNSFSYARDTMKSYQNALIEANWDDEVNTNENEDMILAENMTIRRGGYTYIGTHPFVTSVSDPQILSSGTSASIWASGVIDAESVWAQIIPPNINPETSDIPISDLPSIELTDPDGDHVYEGIYNSFDTEGTYVAVIKALATHEIYSYVRKTMITQNIYSPPMHTSITQTAGTQNIEPDSYEEDDTFSQANVIVLNDNAPQLHYFHDTGDQDWVMFYGVSGETYKIKTSNLGITCDTAIELFYSNGTTRLAGPKNTAGPGENEDLEWECPQDGIYYVKISSANLNFGENIKYDLKLSIPIAPLTGFILGTITDAISGSPIGSAHVTTSSNCSGLSILNGSYIMVHPAGTFTVTAGAAGYISKSFSGIPVNEGVPTITDFELMPIGTDSDGDGVSDDQDNCPNISNQDQTNHDTDNMGDVCDDDDDNDGMPDAWENQYGFNPFVNDASGDADNDGYANLDEYRFGTDPNDPNSTPKTKAMPWIPLLLDD
jgi:hypothetical protein